MLPIPYFDAHCDTVSACATSGSSLRKNAGHLDLCRLSDYVNSSQIFALWSDGGDFRQCRRLYETFSAAMEANGDLAMPCVTGADIHSAHAAGKIAALLSAEGGELLDCDPDKLEIAAGWGVRCVNLTWNHANALAGSHADRPDRGLTDHGREFVRRAEALGVFLDVSHLSDAAFRDLAEMAGRPLVATHSDARGVCPHSRNLTDDMFRVICQTGGAAGLNLYVPFVGGRTMDHVCRHVDHFLELGGEKHLCLGLDLDGCDELAGGLRGVQDLPLLWEALSARGYGRGLLEDLFCNNLLRLMAET